MRDCSPAGRTVSVSSTERGSDIEGIAYAPMIRVSVVEKGGGTCSRGVTIDFVIDLESFHDRPGLMQRGIRPRKETDSLCSRVE